MAWYDPNGYWNSNTPAAAPRSDPTGYNPAASAIAMQMMQAGQEQQARQLAQQLWQHQLAQSQAVQQQQVAQSLADAARRSRIQAIMGSMPGHLQFGAPQGQAQGAAARARFMRENVTPMVAQAQVSASAGGGGNTFQAARLASLEQAGAQAADDVGRSAENDAYERVAAERAQWLQSQGLADSEVSQLDPTGAMRFGTGRDSSSGGGGSASGQGFMSKYGPAALSGLRAGTQALSPYLPSLANQFQQNGLVGTAVNGIQRLPGAIGNLLFGNRTI